MLPLNSADQGEQTPTRPLALISALVLLAFVLILIVWRMQPSAPLAQDAPLAQFSAGRAAAILSSLLGEGLPHPVGSENDQRIGDAIMSRLHAAGYEIDTQQAIPCRDDSGRALTCAPVTNYMARLAGQENGPAVLLVAHFDSAAAGPGAADDGSGVAALLEIARIVKLHGPYRNPIIFLFDDGEERGMLGAQAFVQGHPWAKDVGTVINLEARGASGQSIMFETSDNNAWLIDAYASAVRYPIANSLSYEIYKLLANDTDLTVFKAAGLPGLNFAFIEDAHVYHTSLDNLATLNRASLQHQGESALAVAQALAGRDLTSLPAGNAAYMDVLGFAMLHLPASWMTPLSLCALLALLLLAVVSARRGDLTTRRLLWGLIGVAVSIALAFLFASLIIIAVEKLSGKLIPWNAYPEPLRLAIWASALLTTSLTGCLLARRAGLWALGMAAWLLWAIVALVASIFITSAAIVIMVPLFVAIVLMAAAVVPSQGRRLPHAAALIPPMLAAAAIWLTMALRLESAIGFSMIAAIVVPVALVACTLAPFFAVPGAATEFARRVVGGVAVALVLGAVAAIIVPQYSVNNPQVVNLLHVEERDGGLARWVASGGDQIPQSLLREFDPEPSTVFPWYPGKFPVRSAAGTGLPAPDLAVRSNQPGGGGRDVTLQMGSTRGGQEIEVLLPGKNLSSVTVANQDFTVDNSLLQQGYYQVICYGRACSGMQVTCRFATVDPVQSLVVDFSAGLPRGADTLIQARMPEAIPGNDGDQTIIIKKVQF